jgi:signal transduction histidine kinase
VTYSPLFVSGPKRPGAVLAITRNLTDYMLASEALQQAQADLARLSRVMMLGEMTASIAHEVNQPIAAPVTNAHAGLRWLSARPPDLEEARQALDRIVRDGTRAGEVIGRIRAWVKKMPSHRDLLDINDAIREVIALTQTETQRNAIRLHSRLADHLPLVSADRVQLQQIMINLIINAIEAMAGASDGPRALTIVSGIDDANEVVVEVQDTGPGLDPEQLDRLFQSFYTTKPDGIGMGLAIPTRARVGCRAWHFGHPGGAPWRISPWRGWSGRLVGSGLAAAIKGGCAAGRRVPHATRPLWPVSRQSERDDCGAAGRLGRTHRRCGGRPA